MNKERIFMRIGMCLCLIVQTLINAILLIPTTIFLLVEMIVRRRRFKAFAHDWNLIVKIWAFGLSEYFKCAIGKKSVEEFDRTFQELKDFYINRNK